MSERHLAAVPSAQQMTAPLARLLTDNIRTDIENLWTRLLDAYEKGAHLALGYPSWAEYCKVEFGTSSSRAYQLIDAARVSRAIEAHSTVVERPKSERVARALAPVLREEGEEAVSEAWQEVVQEHGPDATAAEVKRTVRRKNRPGLTAEQAQFANALTSMELAAQYIAAALKNEDEILNVSDETRDEWVRQTRAIDAAATRLRRRFTRR
jgi:hypothetical protein